MTDSIPEITVNDEKHITEEIIDSMSDDENKPDLPRRSEERPAVAHAVKFLKPNEPPKIVEVVNKLMSNMSSNDNSEDAGPGIEDAKEKEAEATSGTSHPSPDDWATKTKDGEIVEHLAFNKHYPPNSPMLVRSYIGSTFALTDLIKRLSGADYTEEYPFDPNGKNFMSRLCRLTTTQMASGAELEMLVSVLKEACGTLLFIGEKMRKVRDVDDRFYLHKWDGTIKDVDSKDFRDAKE